MPFRKILVASDFSAHAEHALEVALDLAQRWGASVTLVHVHEPPVWAPGLEEVLEARAGEARDNISDLLARTAAAARAAGVTDVDTRLVDGVPFVEITRLAREGGYDLIALGTHGRTGIEHVLVGSVAERVVRTAPCAVLTVGLR
jgi:nucleotide-binding universal stress UspA family protein